MATCKYAWDYVQLLAMYASGMSTNSIGAALGRDHRLVRYHLQRAGATIRTTAESHKATSESQFASVRGRVIANHQAGMTVRQIQHKYKGAGFWARIAELCKALPSRELAVPRRRAVLTTELRAALSDSAKAQWERMTAEQRAALRGASIASKLGEKNVNYGKVWSKQGRGKRTPGVDFSGQPVVFRSTWERKFADYLNGRGLPWHYEPEAIKCGDLGTYTPDFYVEPWECFIEVKGWLSPKALKKIEWVRQNDLRPLVLATKSVLRQQYGVEVN